ncbi:MAG TPA: divalent-cation tolerance protein CutA [Pyrinomonadaceae bacterium]|jgi:periplasmic divalent cation tolerance protein
MAETSVDAAIVVMMTAGSREEAARLAEMLVGARLAACVQIMPEMESVYRWKGTIMREPETLLLAKTTASCFAELEREVRALHTYETPEIIAIPITEISSPYFDWLTASVAAPRLALYSETRTAATTTTSAPSEAIED